MPELRIVSTPDAPGAIGPYSQAIVSDGWIFASGQIPSDPATGELVGGDVSNQTERVMRNLAAVLAEAGGSLGTVVKTTVFLSDMALFGDMNQKYEEHFGDHRPARATVAVAGLPKNVDVEIEVVARVGR
ncbi:MAG: RidA family protein [Longimicrobiales bacterium]